MQRESALTHAEVTGSHMSPLVQGLSCEQAAGVALMGDTHLCRTGLQNSDFTVHGLSHLFPVTSPQKCVTGSHTLPIGPKAQSLSLLQTVVVGINALAHVWAAVFGI